MSLFDRVMTIVMNLAMNYYVFAFLEHKAKPIQNFKLSDWLKNDDKD